MVLISTESKHHVAQSYNGSDYEASLRNTQKCFFHGKQNSEIENQEPTDPPYFINTNIASFEPYSMVLNKCEDLNKLVDGKITQLD